MRGDRVILGSLGLLAFVTGCGGATTRMQYGMPLEIRRGYCFVSTQYKQRGQELDPGDVYKRLSRKQESKAYLDAGNSWAIGSIAATLVATGTLTAGILGSSGDVKMDEDVTTALLVTGATVGVLSWVLCITSDGKYVKAAEVYNESLPKPEPDETADPASGPP